MQDGGTHGASTGGKDGKRRSGLGAIQKEEQEQENVQGEGESEREREKYGAEGRKREEKI